MDNNIISIIKTLSTVEVAGHAGRYASLVTLGSEVKKANINIGKLLPYLKSMPELEVISTDVNGCNVCYVRVASAKESGKQSSHIAGKGSTDVRKNRCILLEQWAYLGNINENLAKLAGMAQWENWEYSNGLPKFPKFPILYNYLRYTFCRLQHQKKIVYSIDGQFAAFNTGLTDNRYEPIIAIFKKNRPGNQSEWMLSDFVIEGEDRGKIINKVFDKAIEPATYRDDCSQLVYDETLGEPKVDFEHVLIERVDRLPDAFIEQWAPRRFKTLSTSSMSKEERLRYFDALREAIRNDSSSYRNMMNQLKEAISLAMKRVHWNYSTAIPMFYPKENCMCLLLPLCLIDDSNVDVALVVKRTLANKYEGATILTLDLAYADARVVTRPAGDWLRASAIPGLGETLI